MWECIFDCANLLSCQEDASRVQKKIEGMLANTSLWVRIEFPVLRIERKKVIVGSPEQLELKFVVDFDEGVDPIHLQL